MPGYPHWKNNGSEKAIVASDLARLTGHAWVAWRARDTLNTGVLPVKKNGLEKPMVAPSLAQVNVSCMGSVANLIP